MENHRINKTHQQRTCYASGVPPTFPEQARCTKRSSSPHPTPEARVETSKIKPMRNAMALLYPTTQTVVKHYSEQYPKQIRQITS